MMRTNQILKKAKGNSGFTLMETLGVIAIIAILVTITIVAAFAIQRNVKQTKLDAIAQDIYIAAQDRLTQMYTDNEKILDLSSTTRKTGLHELAATVEADGSVSGAPGDWDSSIPYPGLMALSNNDASWTAYDVLLPEGSLQAEVYGNNWIVEYNALYGYIYGVYYCEQPFDFSDLSDWYTSGDADSYRGDKSVRIGSGIGYYGGGGILGGRVQMTNTTVNVNLDIINAEELRAKVNINLPVEYKSYTVKLDVELKGADSNATKTHTVFLTTSDGYYSRSYELLLDSLNTDYSFNEMYAADGFWAGEDILLTATATLGTGSVSANFHAADEIDQEVGKVVVNSLFEAVNADISSRTANVAYGRHLQNLNNIDTVNLTGTKAITKVLQTRDVDFSYTTLDTDDSVFWWAETYETENTDADGNVISSTVRSFIPINNALIQSFDGGNYSINELNVSGANNGGLFGTFSGNEIKNVNLVGAKVAGAQNAGAFAGVADAADLSVKNTGSYLSRSDYYGKTYSNKWIDCTQNGGGLIGKVEGNVAAENTFAATVLRATVNGGGLFGLVDGTITLTGCYADSYISALTNCGGLVGSVGTSAGSSIDGCYTAGFSVAANTVKVAGFVPSAIETIEDSYTLFYLGADTAGTTKYATVSSGTVAGTVIYIGENYVAYAQATPGGAIGTSESYSALKSTQQSEGAFNGKFYLGSNASKTTAYNLVPGMGLTTYPYPTVTDVHHYGDWSGSAFEPGTLVYFEEYTNSKGETYRGYYGAGSDFLDHQMEDDAVIVKDGYALLYLNDDKAMALDQNATVNGTSVDAAKDYTVLVTPTIVTELDFEGGASGAASTSTERKAVTYVFRDLPYSLVNSEDMAVSSFYTKATVKLTSSDTTYASSNSERIYYFNPLFASTEVEMEDETTEIPTLAVNASNTITIRTPRQLYLFSKYFEKYDFTRSVVFEQEVDMDYSKYHWTDAGFSSAVTSQAPIAGDADHKFVSTYNGMYHVVTGVNVMSDSLYSGLFGYVGSTGVLRNIVVGAEAAANQIVGYSTAPNQTNQTAYIGGLAGYNTGTIINCASAGYSLKANTYNSTTLNAGGIVGANNGRIYNSSSVVPSFAIETNRSNASIGSFVGSNGSSGTILRSYSEGYLSVRRYTNGTVRVAGFAGRNSGTIRNSYTASAMTVSNIASQYVDAFAPTGGTVTNCYYLSDGSFKYCQSVHAYDQTSKTATAAKYGDTGSGVALTTLNLSGFGTVTQSGYFGSTTTDVTSVYPFKSSVTAADGQYIHYGDWVTGDICGSYGMIYWEHETNGANNGYHFYIVTDENKVVETLCTAHDDGGVVSEYGYGWYKQVGHGENGTFTGVNSGSRNNTAETELSKQFAGAYDFRLYTTTGAFSDASSDKMYLSGTSGTGSLTISGKTYTFSPFFAAAISTTGTITDYQVRSIDHLQFLNWNANAKNTSQLVSATATNYKNYPYLYYAQTTSTSTNPNPKKNYGDSAWTQSHDLDMTGQAVSFTPIAGANTSSNNSGYNTILYAWFGGTYDGQSYKISELNIKSKSFTVGLFGVTAGATVKNVILYSEKGAEIVRETSRTDTTGAYTLGGLIGVAYDYGTKMPITNCSVAGYTIIDKSQNKQGLGEANVGGLIGVANVNLEKCSAVTDIEINATHPNGSGGITVANYGNYIRVGGVCGATMGSLTDCYSGGSISVSSAALDENYREYGSSTTKVNYNTTVNNSSYTVLGGKSTNIYLAGIGGSGFAMNYANFTGDTGLHEGNPSFTNCYSYVEFPVLEGTIRSITAIGSIADRYGQSAYVTTKNCYYLGDYLKKDAILSNLATFKVKTDGGSTGDITVKDALTATNGYENMINGSSITLNRMYNKNYNAKVGAGNQYPTSRTFAQMSDTSFAATMGTNWGYVTTRENGVAINGKYSFPAGAPGLDGLNYPFPSVITQDAGTINVHYGEWPRFDGLYASTSSLNLDLLVTDDYSKTVYLDYYQQGSSVNITTVPTLTYDSSIINVTTAVKDGRAVLQVTGLKEGSTTITASYGGYTSTTQVTVTAEFFITAELVTPVRDADNNIVGVEAATDAAVTYQNEELYWQLVARSNEDEIGQDGNPTGNKKVLNLLASNWSITSDAVDVDNVYTRSITHLDDGTCVLAIETGLIGTHNLFVNASKLKGLDGVSTVSGTRATDISFNVKKNPAAVFVYKDMPGTADYTLMQTLYTDLAGNFYTAKNFADDAATAAASKVTRLDVSTMSRTGYDFNGFIGDNGTVFFANAQGVIDTAYAIVADQTNVYGNWTAKEYTLTMNNLEDGTTAAYQETYGSVVDLSAQGYQAPAEQEGYVFGWYDAAAGGNLIVSSSGTFTSDASNYVDASGKWIHDGDVTLYGRYQEVVFTVNYDGNAGTASVPSVDYGYASLATPAAITATATRTGYTFAGWNTAANGTGSSVSEISRSMFDIPNAVPTTTLYAQWTANTYTVHFDGNGATGGTMNDQSFTYDAAQDLTANGFTKTGYHFTGWSGSDGNSYTDQQNVSNLTAASGAVITMTANWEPNTYTVTYHSNYASIPSSETEAQNQVQTVTYDAFPTIYPSSTFEIAHYYIDYWTQSANGTGDRYIPGDPSNDNLATGEVGNTNVDLYAHWKDIPFITLTLNANNASEAGLRSKSYEVELNSTEFEGYQAPTRNNRTLSGWYTQDHNVKVLNADGSFNTDGTASAYIDANGKWIYSNNLTLVAQWTRYRYVSANTLTANENYIITYTRYNNNYAVKNNGTSVGKVSVTISNGIIENMNDTAVVWSAEANTGGIWLKNETKYLSTSNNNLALGTGSDQNYYPWTYSNGLKQSIQTTSYYETTINNSNSNPQNLYYKNGDTYYLVTDIQRSPGNGKPTYTITTENGTYTQKDWNATVYRGITSTTELTLTTDYQENPLVSTNAYWNSNIYKQETVTEYDN